MTRNELIRARRIALGLTQQGACNACQINTSTWQKWEQGVNEISDLLWEKANRGLDKYEEAMNR